MRGVHKAVDIAGRGEFLLENISNTFQEEPLWSPRPWPTMSTCCLPWLNAFGTITQRVPTGGIPFFMMQQRRIFRFKAQRRWLQRHCEMLKVFGLDTVPHRTTLSRRYKALYAVLHDFIAFLGHYAEDLDPRLTSEDLYTDKSLFKAQGPVWHQSDRQDGRIPEKLRHLDTDASWSKSGYHGWVYGYGLHLVDNRVGFPKLVQVETATGAETIVIDHQAEQIIQY